MILAEQFLKSIPLGYKEKVLCKLDKFEKELLACQNKIRELTSGYWVRRIKNSDVFKFRLNNKDRILFTFVTERECYGSSCILFLKYVNHDEQIRVGNNIKFNNIETINIEIDENNYDETDLIEKIIEDDINNFCKNGVVDINEIKAIVAKDEDLKIIANSENNDYLYYLSDEQYEVFKFLDNPILLSGAGGTGKTVVLINALEIAKKSHKKSLYISKNPLLVESIKSIYDKYIGNDKSLLECEFYTIENLECNLVNIGDRKILTVQEITKWIKNNIASYKELKNKDLYEIVTEINGIIKGYLGLEYSEIVDVKIKKSNIISLESYLNIPKQYSTFEENEKRSIYKLAQIYEKWLNNNNYFDENDIAREIIVECQNTKKWDWIVIDEIQDLSEVQIYMISQLVKNEGNIIWAGDINQTINPTFFNYGRIRNLYYTYNKTLKDITLTKNYRTTKEIIELINTVSNLRKKLIGTSNYDSMEIGMRDGKEPEILKLDDDNIKLMFEEVQNKHYCAVVVANEKEKDELICKYPKAEARIFAVNEIKGLEYENIICYNILSSYTDIWRKLLNGDFKHNNNMKYYFNLLYVAISRAKDSLFIFESKLDEIEFTPFNKYKLVTEYNKEELGIVKESSKNDWKNEAERLEKIGQVEKAKIIRDYGLEETLHSLNTLIDNSTGNMFRNVSKEVSDTEEIDKYLNPGIIAYRKRNYGKAMEIFNEVIKKFPNESKGYYYIANAYSYMSGGMEYSIQFFEKAIELDSNKYEYYLDMSAILKQIRNYKRAIEILDIAENKFPHLGNAKEMKAGIYLDMGKSQKAKNLYKSSMKYPKYRFDTVNKIWNKPKIEYNEVVKMSTEESKKEEINKLNMEDNQINIEMPKGIEFLDIKENGIIEECINGIKFKSIKFNKKSKEFYIGFDIERCTMCKDINECIASSCDSKNKVSLNHNLISKLKKEKEKNKKHNSNIDLQDKKQEDYTDNLEKAIKDKVQEELNKIIDSIFNNNIEVEAHGDLEETLINLFNLANKQMHSSLRDYLEYRIENASDIKQSVIYFKYFKDRILRKIEDYFRNNSFPSGNNRFLSDFSDLAREAKGKCSNTDYKYIKNFKSKSYNYQLAYYEVYCNGFIRYGFGILFDGNNAEDINKLKSVNIEVLMKSLDEILDKFTLEKLKASFGSTIENL